MEDSSTLEETFRRARDVASFFVKKKKKRNKIPATWRDYESKRGTEYLLIIAIYIAFRSFRAKESSDHKESWQNYRTIYEHIFNINAFKQCSEICPERAGIRNGIKKLM